VQGLVGSFLRDFGLTVAGSVLLSLFVALTLTPMLASRMPPPTEARARQFLSQARAQLRVDRGALQAVARLTLDHRRRKPSQSRGLAAAACGIGSRLGTEFFPPADEGIFFARIEAAPGTALDATEQYLKQDEAWFLRQPEIVGLFSAAGSSGGGNEAARHAETNMGMIFGTMRRRVRIGSRAQA